MGRFLYPGRAREAVRVRDPAQVYFFRTGKPKGTCLGSGCWSLPNVVKRHHITVATGCGTAWSLKPEILERTILQKFGNVVQGFVKRFFLIAENPATLNGGSQRRRYGLYRSCMLR